MNLTIIILAVIFGLLFLRFVKPKEKTLEEKIIDLIKDYGSLSCDQIKTFLYIYDGSVELTLNDMVERKIIRKKIIPYHGGNIEVFYL